jgi:hypothetical protein
MRKLLLKLQGYVQIDEVNAEWEILQYNLDGEAVSDVDYSKYYIFYNPRKDHYDMIVGGFRPFKNLMHTELRSILNFINTKPAASKIKFWENSQDYFIQKANLEKMIQESYEVDMESKQPEQKEPEQNNTDMMNRVRVVRADLTNYKDNLDKMRSKDQRLINTMQEYKKNVLQKNPTVDIWEDYGNVIITSEGCYFSTYHKYLDFNGDNNEKE